MLKLMKFLISTLLICIGTLSYASDYSVKITVKGFAKQEVIIARIQGDMSMYTDTIVSDMYGNAIATFNDDTPIGMYSFVFPKLRNAEVTFIFNKENIAMETEAVSPQTFVKVISSKENAIYYLFKKEQQMFQSNIDILEYTNDHYTGKNYVEATKKEYTDLIKSYNDIIQSILNQSKNLFVYRIVLASRPIVPPQILSESQKNTYLQAHFFDNFDFTDTILFASNVYTDACITYLGLYSNQYQTAKNSAVFIKAIDTIIAKTVMYPKTFDFVVNYLLNGFESMGAVDMMQYISSVYLEHNSCSANTTKTTLQHKALSNTELAIGKKIPTFEFTTSKKQYTNTDFNSGVSVFIFWASWCGHCTEMMPQIVSDYAKNPSYKLYTFSLDTVPSEWKAFLDTAPGFSKSTNLCDSKSWEGIMTQAFHVYATPTVFIIKDGIIVGKPMGYEDYKKQILKITSK